MTIEEMQQRWNPHFDFSLTYYLSGPMEGYPGYNYAAFTDAAEVLRATGVNLQSPHENPWPDEHMGSKDLWDYMMHLAIDQMDKCEAIILLKGWPQSAGARSELEIAMQRNWPVWYYHDYQLTNMNLE